MTCKDGRKREGGGEEGRDRVSIQVRASFLCPLRESGIKRSSLFFFFFFLLRYRNFPLFRTIGPFKLNHFEYEQPVQFPINQFELFAEEEQQDPKLSFESYSWLGKAWELGRSLIIRTRGQRIRVAFVRVIGNSFTLSLCTYLGGLSRVYRFAPFRTLSHSHPSRRTVWTLFVDSTPKIFSKVLRETFYPATTFLTRSSKRRY